VVIRHLRGGKEGGNVSEKFLATSSLRRTDRIRAENAKKRGFSVLSIQGR